MPIIFLLVFVLLIIGLFAHGHFYGYLPIKSKQYVTEYFNVRYWDKSSGRVESMVVKVSYDKYDPDKESFIQNKITTYIIASDKGRNNSSLVSFEKIPNL